MKVIFLDIDGVMNCRRSVKADIANDRRPYSTFDADCVDALNRIIKTCDAVIVVSSTWRIYRPFQDLVKDIESQGVIKSKVIDTTPILNGANRKRGHEIMMWLQDMKDSGTVVDSFVILDDDSGMDVLIGDLVQTQTWVGLTDKHADMAIDHLNKTSDIFQQVK